MHQNYCENEDCFVPIPPNEKRCPNCITADQGGETAHP